MQEMRGADYVALVRLTDRPGNVLAMPGQTCERVPPESLEGLARRGKIEHRPAVVDEQVIPLVMLGRRKRGDV